MLGLKLIHVSKRGPRSSVTNAAVMETQIYIVCFCVFQIRKTKCHHFICHSKRKLMHFRYWLVRNLWKLLFLVQALVQCEDNCFLQNIAFVIHLGYGVMKNQSSRQNTHEHNFCVMIGLLWHYICQQVIHMGEHKLGTSLALVMSRQQA